MVLNMNCYRCVYTAVRIPETRRELKLCTSCWTMMGNGDKIHCHMITLKYPLHSSDNVYLQHVVINTDLKRKCVWECGLDSSGAGQRPMVNFSVGTATNLRGLYSYFYAVTFSQHSPCVGALGPGGIGCTGRQGPVLHQDTAVRSLQI
jgi:hypothetical protein